LCEDQKLSSLLLKGGIMTISRLGQRRQVVIPKEVCAELGLEEGDFLEVRSSKGAVVIKRKKPVDPDDILTAEEAALVRKGEQQLARGESITLDDLERALDRKPRKRSRKTA
jgi:AbrB family looped-hinge helix DNA binding protein